MAGTEVEVGSGGEQPSNHSWTRDNRGRVTELRFDNSLVMSVEYTPGGLVDRRRHYNESGGEIARTTVKYDVLGRKESEQTCRTSSNQVLSHVVLEYDDGDRIVAKELRHLGVRQEFEYNPLGELTRDSSDGNSGWSTAPEGLWVDPKTHHIVRRVTDVAEQGLRTTETYASTLINAKVEDGQFSVPQEEKK